MKYPSNRQDAKICITNGQTLKEMRRELMWWRKERRLQMKWEQSFQGLSRKEFNMRWDKMIQAVKDNDFTPGLQALENSVLVGG